KRVIISQFRYSGGRNMNLIEAIKENNQTEFFRLLSLKTDHFGKRVIDEIDEEYERNPLHIAVAYGHLHFIGPLITAGINVNKPDKNGETPVFAAALRGHAETITLLEAAGANVDTPNDD